MAHAFFSKTGKILYLICGSHHEFFIYNYQCLYSVDNLLFRASIYTRMAVNMGPVNVLRQGLSDGGGSRIKL